MSVSKLTLSDKVCVICRGLLMSSEKENIHQVTRGLDTLIEYSGMRNDSELHDYLLSMPAVVYVHSSCRLRYTSKRRFGQLINVSNSDSMIDTDSVSPKALRSSAVGAFDWKHHCFFCNKSTALDEQHPEVKADIRHVETLELRQRVLEHCSGRTDDSSMAVQGRVLMCSDLVAAGAVYHKNCHRSFFEMRPFLEHSKGMVGRPVDKEKVDVFDKLCEWLEADVHDLLKLNELTEKAQTFAGANVYSHRQLKRKL